MRCLLFPIVVAAALVVVACAGPELRGGLVISACVPSSTLDQVVLFSPGEVELLDGETLDEVIISFVDEPVSAVQVGAGVSNLNPGDVYTLRTTNSAPSMFAMDLVSTSRARPTSRSQCSWMFPVASPSRSTLRSSLW